jgi:predicted MFS family arabinose efflux permease
MKNNKIIPLSSFHKNVGMRQPALKSSPPQGREGHAPWSVLVFVVLAGLAGTLNYYKVPPIMPLLINTFQVSRGTAGFLMSIFAVAGISLAIPAGLILDRLRGRTTGTIAVCFIALGSGLGALSTHIGLMLVSRLVEGIGLTLMAVVAPMVVAYRFSFRKRSIALGILNVWFPLASTIALLGVPSLATRWGWQSVWWCGTLYAVIAGLLYFLFIKPLPRGQGGRVTAGKRKSTNARSVFFSGDIWLIGLTFCCFSSQYGSFLTWTPTFLHTVRGTSLASSSLIMSFVPILGLISAPLAGWMVGRVLQRRLMCAIAMALFSALLPWASVLNVQHLIPLMAAIGFISSMIPAVMLTLVADLSLKGETTSMPQAVAYIGQSTGILIGPTAFGVLVDLMGGWSVVYWLLLPVGLVGAVAALLLRWRLLARIRAGITPAGSRY